MCELLLADNESLKGEGEMAVLVQLARWCRTEQSCDQRGGVRPITKQKLGLQDITKALPT